MNADFVGALFGDDNSSPTYACASGFNEWNSPKLEVPDKGLAAASSLADLINTTCKWQCDIDSVTAKYKELQNFDRVMPPLVN